MNLRLDDGLVDRRGSRHVGGEVCVSWGEVVFHSLSTFAAGKDEDASGVNALFVGKVSLGVDGALGGDGGIGAGFVGGCFADHDDV